MYHSLNQFIAHLEKENELIRIKEFVDPKLEITEITDRISKHNGKALLFENTGTAFPLLINAYGSEKRIGMALRVNHLDDIAAEIEGLFKMLMKPKDNILDKLKLLPQLGAMASWMPKISKARGGCQQVVMADPDVTKLPVMTCWPHDGGPFITLPVINTRDPLTGIRNVGMYRMQVFGPRLTGMHWHKHKVSAKHFNEYKKLNQKMPVAVVLGGDPVYTYAATAPLPENVDEYMLAGFLRKKNVQLVKCLTQDIHVPADADFVIEGYVDPAEDFILEGPFGDHTGYYSLADYYPKFHITCITHRKDAIYPSTIVGIPPQEDAWLGKATERIFLAPIKMTMVPEIVDMELPIEGVFHNLTIVKIKKDYAGQAQKVMNAMWGAGQMMFNKILVVVDEHVNISNYKDVAQIITANVDPQQDIYFSQGPMDVLDHSCSKFAFGGKMCIDATTKYEEEKRVPVMPAATFTQLTTNETAAIKTNYPEITSLNTSLLSFGISAVIIAVHKNRPGHIRELNKKLLEHTALSKVKFILFLEGNVPTDHIADAIWRAANNLDAKRDVIITEALPGTISHAAFDGTRKTRALDGFERDWPNILVSNEHTIAQVDQKWDKLGIGSFLESPSRRYLAQVYQGGAVAAES
ncbi:MAG: menaquinone biosynthesis decarboxylase [Bacteroidota bacterium]